MMQIRYDADAMYIALRGGDVESTRKIDNYTLIDLDGQGNVLGLELLFVKERNPGMLKLRVENLDS